MLFNEKKTAFTTGLVILSALFTVIAIVRPPRPGGHVLNGEWLFKKIETNKDDKISEAEWTAYHAKISIQIDKNRDGYLSEEELTSQWEKDEGRRSERNDMLFQLLSNHN